MSDLSAHTLARLWRDQNIQKEAAKADTDTAHGSAAWASQAEIEAAGYYSGSLLTGRSFGRLLWYQGNGHCLTFAPTGSGKSVSVVVPNLLTYPGSIVCIDPKGALPAITASRRMALGQQVVLLDPFAEVATAMSNSTHRYGQQLPTSSFNPFSHLDPSSPQVTDDARLLASSLITQETEKNRFFSDSAQATLEGMILYLLATGGPASLTIENILNMAFTNRRTFVANCLEDMLDCSAFNGKVSRLANQIADFSLEGGASIWSTLRQNLGKLESPQLFAALQPSTLNFRKLKDTPTTVYLVLPATHLHSYATWLRLMLSSILRQLSDSRTSRYPVLFLIDECAALGRLEILETAVGLMRGYGMKLWLIFQDLSQLQSIYGQRWPSFVSNSGIKQFFNVNDVATAEYVSKYLGSETRYVQSEGLSAQTQLTSSNISASGRPLLTPDEVLRLEVNDQILFYEGSRPIHSRKLSYWQDPEFQGLFAPDPYIARRL